nr:hypothetical protein [uncultured Dongia sp.]
MSNQQFFEGSLGKIGIAVGGVTTSLVTQGVEVRIAGLTFSEWAAAATFVFMAWQSLLLIPKTIDALHRRKARKLARKGALNRRASDRVKELGDPEL